ncbi:hypothetical protein LVD13_07340 [Flavobacteriaceae bacterium D16]|nr:hypothetical protein [Flavobacteriaceae bacterium D16]
MIYIISGSSRSGKTIVAKKLMLQINIPYLSLDWLVMGFTNGIPEYGIHDKLWPDEIAEKVWDYLEAMLESMIWSGADVIIEGEAILPELISRFSKKHPKLIKICYVGYSNISIEQKVKEIYQYSKGKNDWLTKESKAYIEDHTANMITYSKRIEKACKKYGLHYFDTSDNFTETLDKVIAYLLKNPLGK